MIIMREEVKNLFEQGIKDLEVAEKNFALKEYYISAFLCQQAVEKYLKAFFIIKNAKSPGPTHSLIYLAKETGIPKDFFNFLGDLSPEFITTRYPDISGEAPYKIYHYDKVKNYINKSKELIKWIDNQIKKQ